MNNDKSEINSEKYFSLDQIHDIEFDILLCFDKFCKENNIEYFLCTGTLLGAIRHHGFIPWDDDIDVCMMRDQYNKFISLWKDKNRYKLKCPELNNSIVPYAKIVDTETVTISEFYNDEDNNNLWIDIFPMDGFPNDINASDNLVKKMAHYRFLLSIINSKSGKGSNIVKIIGKLIMKPFLMMYGKKRLINKISQIAQNQNISDCKYVGNIVWGVYGLNEKIKQADMKPIYPVSFEEHEFSAFSCWDNYLSGLYGNYMEFPPENCRNAHHILAYKKTEVKN